MTRQILPLLTGWWLALRWPALLLLLTLLAAPLPSAANVIIQQAHVESSDEGYKLSANFGIDLNHGLEDVLSKGIALYFTTDVKLTRPRWYWFDETAVSASRTIRIQYDLLTRRYTAGPVDSVKQNFNSLEDVLSLLRRPSRWVIAERGTLKPGESYQVAVRMGLDLAHLTKPYQVHALNSSDWQLTSDWKRFSYKAE